MIVLTTSDAQTVSVGDAILFDTTVLRSGTTECHRTGTGSVKMRAKALYKATFTGNVGGATGSDTMLIMSVSGDELSETQMISVPAASDDLNNVSATTVIRNCCCDYDRISVVNNGSLAANIGAGATLIVEAL